MRWLGRYGVSTREEAALWHRLYTAEECRKMRAKSRTAIRPYCIHKKAPAVIVCPGGAYQFVSCENEGEPIAKALNRAGYHAFVLRYRVGRSARYPAPMEDLARAMAWVQAHGAQWDVDVKRISIFGASAAGHLCAYFGARYNQFSGRYLDHNYNLRPYAVVLTYPVINLVSETHACTRDTLLGRRASLEERKDKSPDLILTPSYPPVFIWHCTDDPSVPVSNSRRFATALEQNGIPFRYCEYPTGGHGIGLAQGTSAQEWMTEAIRFLSEIESK